MWSNLPACVIVFSGKRKSGKDFVTELLMRRFGDDKVSILRLSAPLKQQYAKEHNLDFNKLLDASDYKEKYREDMIQWGEDKRNKDPDYFCRLICAGPGSTLPVWIISDARRKTDIDYFMKNFSQTLITVRVAASEETRASRGWMFTPGVDDAESECGLDDLTHDYIIHNDADVKTLEENLAPLMGKIASVLS